jgi:hypothetical protein
MDKASSNHWTVETLREYTLALIASNDVKYRERFESSQSAVNAAFIAQQTAMQTALTAQKLAIDTALAAADRAVTKAEVAAEKRFESVNEFRASLADQQRTLMPRSESELLIKTLTDKIDANTRALSATASQKAGANGLWGYIVGALGVVLAIIFHFVK